MGSIAILTHVVLAQVLACAIAPGADMDIEDSGSEHSEGSPTPYGECYNCGSDIWSVDHSVCAFCGLIVCWRCDMENNYLPTWHNVCEICDNQLCKQCFDPCKICSGEECPTEKRPTQEAECHDAVRRLRFRPWQATSTSAVDNKLITSPRDSAGVGSKNMRAPDPDHLTQGNRRQ